MNNLIVNEEEIRGVVKDIKRYMITELSNYLDASDEDLDTWVDMIYNVNLVLQAIIDKNNNDYVVLKYNPMGSWYIESEEE